MNRRGGTAGAMGALLALSGLCVAERAGAEEGLIIETGSPDALCPELASTQAAVRRRLGELIVPGGSSGFRARYTIAHAPVGSPRDFVRLELYGPEGTLQLSRDLPLEGESCSTMAEVIALVLDRHFRSLLAHDGSDDEPTAAATSEARSASPSPLPGELAEVPASPDPRAAGVPSADAASASTAAVSPAGASHLASFGVEVGLRSPDLPALGVRALLELGPSWYAGTALHLGLTAQTEALSGGGEASSRHASWRLNLGYGPRLGPVRTFVGPGLCLGIDRGSGDRLPQSGSGFRATWAVGLDVGALWVTDEGWTFGVAAALDVTVLSGRFDIDGQEVLTPEAVRGWFGLSMGHAL